MTTSPDTPPAISVRQLRKMYGSKKTGQSKEALKGIDLDIPRGSFFGLLGPNGAGKSTFINILAGLVVKTGGQALVCGHDIEKDMRAARLAIGVVPQELVLDTFFTVRQALEIQAGYYGVPASRRRTDEIIEAMGLTDKANVHSRGLSGGMRRRLLIAKALVHTPPVLVLDEPTAGVDVELRQQLWRYVQELNRQGGTTVLLTTHYLEEAETLCDRIAIINHGEVVACDEKKKLMRGFDSKQLIIRFKDSPAVRVSESLPEGWSWHADGSLVVRYRPSKTDFEALLAQVKTLGLTIADISTSETDLEDIFIHLTSKQAA